MNIISNETEARMIPKLFWTWWRKEKSLLPGTVPFLTNFHLKTDLSWAGANTQKLTLN
jgi:hypothetical protein